MAEAATQPATRARRRGIRFGGFAAHAVLALGALLSVAPLLWIFLSALKSRTDAVASPPVWVFTPQWRNFAEAWSSNGFGYSFAVTTAVSLLSVAMSIVIAIPASYAMARYQRRWLEVVFVAILAARILPEILFVTPLYVLFQFYGLFDTPLGLALAFQIFNLPYCIWLLRQFIAEVPRELDEAAALDGAGTATLIVRVITPVIVPGIMTAAILSIISVWTNLLLPLTLTYNQTPMIATTIANFQGYGSFNLPVLSAAAIISLLPQLLFFLFAQRFIVKGLTAGAVKS
jgi:multiple sugar transport system permease protein